MLIDLCSGLRADIAPRTIELQSTDSILAGDARKLDAPIDGLCRVISHALILVLLRDRH
jgi:hypothetical protein